MSAPQEETRWSESALKNVEDMFAEGLSWEDIADLLNIALATLKKYANSNLEFRKAIKRGEERAAMVDMDRKRRTRIEKQATWFIPTEEELLEIEAKMRLGWPETKIAESFDLPISVWTAAKKKQPEIQAALKRGEAQSQGKLHYATLEAWKPTLEDLVKIRELAAKGLAPQAISTVLGYGPTVLETHMHSIPELQDAYEAGLRECETIVTNALMMLVKQGNVGATIFWLKSRNKKYWSDSAPAAGQFREAAAAPANAVTFEIPKQKDDDSFQKKSEKFRKERLKQQNE